MNRTKRLARISRLETRTPLARTGGLRTVSEKRAREARERKSAPKGAAPGPRRDTGPDAATRQAVYLRDDRRCVCCGTPIDGRPHSVGHRKRRSQRGGNRMSNLLTFLGLGINPLDPDDHHARIDSRRDPHDEAKGYTVRSWDDPAQIGVMIFSEHGSGVTKWLSDDGAYLDEAPEVAA